MAETGLAESLRRSSRSSESSRRSSTESQDSATAPSPGWFAGLPAPSPPMHMPGGGGIKVNALGAMLESFWMAPSMLIASGVKVRDRGFGFGSMFNKVQQPGSMPMTKHHPKDLSAQSCDSMGTSSRASSFASLEDLAGQSGTSSQLGRNSP